MLTSGEVRRRLGDLEGAVLEDAGESLYDQQRRLAVAMLEDPEARRLGSALVRAVGSSDEEGEARAREQLRAWRVARRLKPLFLTPLSPLRPEGRASDGSGPSLSVDGSRGLLMGEW